MFVNKEFHPSKLAETSGDTLKQIAKPMPRILFAIAYFISSQNSLYSSLRVAFLKHKIFSGLLFRTCPIPQQVNMIIFGKMSPMKFELQHAFEILDRTPAILHSMLYDLPETWTEPNEGENTWSAYDIVGHLIHGEKTDWITRAEIILSSSDNKKFEPFDRFAQFADSKGKSLNQLLDEFKKLRQLNLEKFRTYQPDDLSKTGVHPAFGEVTLKELLATWVVHDLNHIAQISRVMAKQYKEEVGPWIEYLGILRY